MSIYTYGRNTFFSFSPPPPSEIDESNEGEQQIDFLLDPDKLHDRLPQPYRMINKIVVQLLDNVWNLVDTKEKASEVKNQKFLYRAPPLRDFKKLSVLGNATALNHSPDGKFIFVGLPNGLSVFESSTEKIVSSWSNENAEISFIGVSKVNEDICLVSTLDDMGICRVFLFLANVIFLVKTMNENSLDNPAKVLCQKVEASFDSSYVGFLFENTGSNDAWLEFHKTPIDNWEQQLETANSLIAKHREKEQTESAQGESNNSAQPEEIDAPEPAALDEAKENNLDVESELQESKEPKTITEEDVLRSSDLKFSVPTNVLKVKKLPKVPFQASTASSIASAINKVDLGDVLGNGANHILGAGFLESFDKMFNYRYEEKLEYLPEEIPQDNTRATFHFLGPSRMIAQGQDQPPNTPVSVCVWWSSSPHLYHYSLLKPSKDLEQKPELVWPFSDYISCSNVSDCSTYMAIGLKNGNLILWDRQKGIEQAVFNVSTNCGVRSVKFLDPSLFPFDTPSYPPYQLMSATYLVVECENGVQLLYDTCDGSHQAPRFVSDIPESDNEIQTLLQTVPGVPELMLYVQKNGELFIKDICTGASICQIDLPASQHLQTPWNPIYAFGENGSTIFVKSKGTEVEDEGEASDISAIFSYDLQSSTLLQEYWSRKRLPSVPLNTYIDNQQRAALLMKDRIAQQMVRKPRLQKRWGQLKSELEKIQRAKRTAVDALEL